MEPLQYDLRCPAPKKHNSITHAAAAPTNLDAAITMRSAQADLQNTKELRATAWEIAAPKPDLGAKAKKKDNFEALFERTFKKKITSSKIEKILWQIIIAALMEPFQYDLPCPAAKDNGITHAAAAPSKLDVAITKRSAQSALQNTQELCATAWEIAAPKPDLGATAKKKDNFEAIFKRTCKKKITSGKIEKILWQIIIAALMEPFQYDLRCPAAKDNNYNAFLLLLGTPQILKTRVHLQFWKNCGWPIWLLIDPI